MTLGYGLLALLAREADDLLGLHADFEALFDNLWSVSVEQVTEALVGLEQGGLAAQRGRAGRAHPERPIYEPTASGRRTSARWLKAPVGSEVAIEDELTLKLALNEALKAGHALSLIWKERQASMNRLEQLYALRDSGALMLPATLLLERVIMAQEARVRWLEFCEERLVDEPQAPAVPTG